MAKVRIECPECGFAKEVDSEKLPASRVKVTCPKCKVPFTFDAAAAEAAGTHKAVPPPEEAPAPPPEPAMPQPDTARITCPGCGFFKDIPKDKVPASPRDVKCPKCGLAFQFGPEGETPAPEPPKPPEQPSRPAPPPPSPPPSPSAEQTHEDIPAPDVRALFNRKRVRPSGLTDIGGLFSYAWEKYKKRGLALVGLQFLSIFACLAAVALFMGVGYLVSTLLPSGGGMAIAAGTGFGAVAGFIAVCWVLAGFFFAVADETLAFRDALSLGRNWLWSFAWLNLVMTFLIMGGYLFLVIPGLVFTLWFSLSPFVLAEERETGMNAILKSRQYVLVSWPGVLLRLFVIWLVMMAVGAIPVAGAILTYVAMPFAALYVHRVYLDLKEMRGDAAYLPSTGEKAKWLGLSAFGYVFIPLLIFAFATSFTMKHGMSFDQMMKEMGLDFDTISMPSIGASTGKGGELEEAYNEYRDALDDGDIERLKLLVASDVASDLDGPSAPMMVGMMKAFMPKGVYATGADIEGDSGTLHVEAEQGGGIVSGEVSFVKQGGGWKLSKESWSMNVRPKPVKLKGGKGAPDFRPVPSEYLSAPPMYGMVSASAFYEGSDAPKLLKTLRGHEGGVRNVAFVLGGTALLSSSYDDYTVRLWDYVNGVEISGVKLEYRPVDMAVTPDGYTAVITDAYGGVSFLEVGAGGIGQGVRAAANLGHESRVAVSPNGKLFATSSFDKMVTIWDLQAKKELARIETPEPMRGITFSPSGQVLAVGSTTHKLTLWDLSRGEGRTYTVSKVNKDSDISSVAISADSKYLVTGHMDSSIVIWDMETMDELFNFYVTDASTFDVGFSPDGSQFASAQANGDVLIWEPSAARKLGTLNEGGGEVFPTGLAFRQDGSLLATVSSANEIHIWGRSLNAPVDALTQMVEDFSGGMQVSVSMDGAGPGGQSGASVWLDKTVYEPGEQIRVSFNAPAGYASDAWIGIIPSSVSHGSESENDRHDMTYQYLSGRTTGDMIFNAPSSPGSYDFRMHDTDNSGREVAFVTFTVGSAGTAPAPQAPLPQAPKVSTAGEPAYYHANKPLDQIMIYIYSLNYKGAVYFNGQQYYVIEGERDMNYNATNYVAPVRGLNRFVVDYEALPDPWMTELKIKVYIMDENYSEGDTLAEWVINDPGGKKTLDLNINW